MKFVTIQNNKVISTREGPSIVEGEIENVDNLECGMELINGVWGFPPVVPPTPQPTVEEQFTELKNNQLILMDVIATMYEDMLAKGTV